MERPAPPTYLHLRSGTKNCLEPFHQILYFNWKVSSLGKRERGRGTVGDSVPLLIDHCLIKLTYLDLVILSDERGDGGQGFSQVGVVVTEQIRDEL